MRSAANFVALSAGLHVLGVALAGFATETLFLLAVAVLYALLFAGLVREMMWVAWLAFVVMLVGAAAALSSLFDPSPVPVWVFWAILPANVVAAVWLFAVIWAGPGAREGEA